MALYETVFIARQDIPAQEVEELVAKFRSIVADNGGMVGRHEYWGLRNLAYRIKKNRKGHYTMLHIDASPEAIGEMERNMRIDEDILRYLTIRSDALEEGPSVMMQSRAPRDVGPERGPKEQKAESVDKLDGANEAPGESPQEVNKSGAVEADEETAQ
ncbi:MAG: 30S ribosomal protein S6 [Rhodospirillaceae bacterium]|nr:30S ribosomal protein S6 [Rhodospirillaceae bacterium]|tara:strand:+ start:1980 stop:2453 length:474 start_codon:yes stop_codon:yes gene_type:complete